MTTMTYFAGLVLVVTLFACSSSSSTDDGTLPVEDSGPGGEPAGEAGASSSAGSVGDSSVGGTGGVTDDGGAGGAPEGGSPPTGGTASGGAPAHGGSPAIGGASTGGAAATGGTAGSGVGGGTAGAGGEDGGTAIDAGLLPANCQYHGQEFVYFDCEHVQTYLCDGGTLQGYLLVDTGERFEVCWALGWSCQELVDRCVP